MSKRASTRLIAAGACALALAACSDPEMTRTPAGGSGSGGSPTQPRAGTGGSPPVAGGSAGAAAGAGGAGAGARANAAITGFMGGTITGTAAFTQTGTDVNLTITVMNCPDGAHPVHIHAGTACTDAMTQGTHWGGDGPPTTRGEGIPDIMCTGGTGTTSVTRKPSDGPTLTWSIGGAAETNIVGHVMVVHNPDKSRIGCGLIQ